MPMRSSVRDLLKLLKDKFGKATYCFLMIYSISFVGIPPKEWRSRLFSFPLEVI